MADLATWKTTPEEAHRIALQNLADRSPESFKHMAPGLYMGPWDDNYAATRVLLQDKIRQQTINGDPVVLIPNRDSLLLTGSNDTKGLSNLASIGADLYKQPRMISGIALRLNGNEWIPYLPDCRHPAFKTLNLLRLDTIEQLYANQRHLLTALHDQRQKDTFVAAFKAWKNVKTGKTYTTCIWQYHFTNALLPKTDLVYFASGKHGSKPFAPVCSWDCVVRICGDLIEKQDMYPERYRVSHFPSEAQIAELEKVAIKDPILILQRLCA
jgi:hypothetical protein